MACDSKGLAQVHLCGHLVDYPAGSDLASHQVRAHHCAHHPCDAVKLAEHFRDARRPKCVALEL